jgi:BirA family biotin operon repressor/biotin-[acetyl-CoA-carboxylase] ligase
VTAPEPPSPPLDRPPLDRARLDRVPEGGPPWTAVEVVEEAGSTNADLVARARAGEPEGLVLVAEHQTHGRGRLDRTWVTPPRSALTFSVLLRPGPVPRQRWPWLPLLAGVAVVEAVNATGGPSCSLKWPNDVLHAGAKLGGLLAEQVDSHAGPAVVLGIGLNVSTTEAELPVPAATSLLLAGHEEEGPAQLATAPPDRTALLRAVLGELGRRYVAWRAEGGDPATGLAADYERVCDTLGREVRVLLPAGTEVRGVAQELDAAGGLVVVGPTGRQTVHAGDVVHVRPGDRRPGEG